MSIRTENIKKVMAGKFYLEFIPYSDNAIDCVKEFNTTDDIYRYKVYWDERVKHLHPKGIFTLSNKMVGTVTLDFDQMAKADSANLPNNTKCLLHFLWLLDNTPEDTVLDVDISALHDEWLDIALNEFTRIIRGFRMRLVIFDGQFDAFKLSRINCQFIYNGTKYDDVDDLLDEFDFI